MRHFYISLVVSFSLCIYIIISSTISYASMSISTKDLIYSQCQTLNEKGAISSATLEYINSKLYNSNTFNGTNFGNDYFILICKGTRYNGGGHNYSKLSTNMSIYIGCCKTGATSIVNYTNDINNSFYTNWSTSSVWGGFRCNVNNKTDYNDGNFGYNDALDGFYIYTTVNINTRLIQLNSGEEFGGQYLLDYGLQFTPFNNNLITVDNISNVHLENFSRTVSQWQLGTLLNLENGANGKIEIYQGENNQWQVVANLFWNGSNEVFVNNNNLYYYQLYRIYFYDNDFNYTDTYGYYFLPIGETYSGESAIFYGNDNNNYMPIIENQNENQSFWESTYNNLFSMDSGDVNEVYLLVQSYFPSGDTPLSVYDTIFGAYGNEPDDFIIRWDDHPLNITWFGGQQLYSGDFIKAGYMNFSKECRDNDVLGNIKFWLNTLLTIFIFIAYYKFLYKCFCDMLGVISEDIQEDEPEHRPIGFGRGDK